MDFKVGLTDEAIADLAGIAAFVAQRGGPSVAQRVGHELLALAESLGEFPHRGAPLKGRPAFRRVFRWNFVVYYRVHEAEKRVEVLRIWDGRRAPGALVLP